MLSLAGILFLVAAAQAKSVDNGKSMRRQFVPSPLTPPFPSVRDWDIQLTGGDGTYGKIEIYYRGLWYSVCDDSFHDNEAIVACRQLGFRYALREENHLQYDYGVPGVLLDEVTCNGAESRLADCFHLGVGIHDCDGRLEAATIRCSHQPFRTVNNYRPIDSGLGRVQSLDIQSARVSHGPHTGEGLLEVQVDGQYKFVCTNNWDNMDAKVACRMMGFTRGEAVSPYPYNYNINFWQIQNMWMDDFQCGGTENALDQCPNMGYDRYTSNCVDKNMIAAVRCTTGSAPPAADTPVILSGGRTPYEGAVKCLHGDQYYPVCADNFGPEEAQVICNQLFGYRGMIGIPIRPSTLESNAYYMQGFYDTQCQGNEPSLTQCFSNFISNRQRACQTGDATVVCS